MDPLQIQKLVEAQVERKATEVFTQENIDRQYKVTKIPVHVHTGQDSPQVQFSDLATVQQHSVVTRVTLTPAQVKALFTTPITLVPQPGRLSVIIVDSITCRLAYAGTAYASLHNLEFHYTDGNGQQVTDAVPASFLSSTSSAYYHAPAVSGSFAPVAGNSATNGRIVAFVNTANPTLGTSPITIVVKYRIVPFNS